MARMKLTMGVDSPSPSGSETKRRIAVLKETVEHYLPAFAASVHTGDVDMVIMHQDAFAAGYDRDEYTLLGMAIKYAGLYDKRLMIGGRNNEKL